MVSVRDFTAFLSLAFNAASTVFKGQRQMFSLNRHGLCVVCKNPPATHGDLKSDITSDRSAWLRRELLLLQSFLSASPILEEPDYHVLYYLWRMNAFPERSKRAFRTKSMHLKKYPLLYQPGDREWLDLQSWR